MKRWPTDGPAVALHDTTYYPSFAVGTTFTDGIVKFVVSGSQPAVIKSVEVLAASPGLKVLGGSVAGPARKYATIETLPGYPPADRRLGPIHPAEGYEVRPGPVGAELLVGTKVEGPGMQRRSGVRVAYSVGSRTFEIDYHAAIVNCPHGTPLKRCESSSRQLLVQDVGRAVACGRPDT